MTRWEPVIGLEVHVQLNSSSKIFSGAATAYGSEPNAQACPVSIALPGVLPVMNREAARLAVLFGLGINAQINRRSVFERKNYFYPDLPKGYQISQYEHPVVGRGSISIETGTGRKLVGITRAHLEEDAGKLLHEHLDSLSGVDLNRAGIPLLEIVSEPDMRSAREAVAYLKKLHVLIRYLGISDGNMQEGSFRCDANVSVRPMGEYQLGTRTEIKNVNSFRFVEKAINHEISRQIDLIEYGGKVVQETRLYDSDRDETRSMRSKEEANDYRYFPDPDLPEMVLDESFIESVRQTLPELPDGRARRFAREMGLSETDAEKLAADRDTADYLEAVCKQTRATAKTVANWINGELAAALNERNIGIGSSPVDPFRLAALLDRIEDGTITGKIAKEVFACLLESDASADDVIQTRGLQQITDLSKIEQVVDDVLAVCPQQIEQYRQGNLKIIGFLVGQVMKQTNGKANPRKVTEILKNRLD